MAKASKPEQEPFIGNQPGGRVFLFLNSDDFWRDYNDLVGKGINFVRDPKQADFGMVEVFEDLYGNLWDLLQLNEEHPLSNRRYNDGCKDNLLNLVKNIAEVTEWIINKPELED